MKFLLLGFLFFPHLASAGIPGFSPIDPSYTNPSGQPLVIENMPRIQSQDTLGVCYSYTAGAILDAANCKYDDLDCKNLPKRESFSRLDLTRYSTDVPKDLQYRSAYDGGIKEGGAPLNIIQNMLLRRTPAANEECASLDKALVHFGDSKQLWAAQEKAWVTLKTKYAQFKENEKKCATCAADFFTTAVDEIRQDFNLKQDNTEILKAFSQVTYEKFLGDLLVPKQCSNKVVYLENAKNLQLETFPNDPLGFSTYDESLDKIKSALANKNPVLVNSLCLDQNYDIPKAQQTIVANNKKIVAARSRGTTLDKNSLTPECKNEHSLVVSGYRKICKKNNPQDCRVALKVHNSWGEGWQKQNDDGWVDAKTLLDRTAYQVQSFAWIQDKNKSQSKSQQNSSSQRASVNQEHSSIQ
ncbi:hypothetical protein D3C87_189950 [compost metagenome]